MTLPRFIVDAAQHATRNSTQLNSTQKNKTRQDTTQTRQDKTRSPSQDERKRERERERRHKHNYITIALEHSKRLTYRKSSGVAMTTNLIARSFPNTS